MYAVFNSMVSFLFLRKAILSVFMYQHSLLFGSASFLDFNEMLEANNSNAVTDALECLQVLSEECCCKEKKRKQSESQFGQR